MVQTHGKISNTDTAELFDETVGYDDEVGVRFAEGLSLEEKRRASLLYHLFNELWGICLVLGAPGLGKDLFGNYLSYKLKTYFPWKRVLRDEKPKKLYGAYAGLFNEAVLQDDLARMRQIAKGTGKTHIGEVLDKVADNWVTETGQVMLKNSILYLTEFWRYCYNREPHNPMNKTMGAIHRMKRHLDCFVIGTGAGDESELDKKTCLPYIDWKVICTRSKVNKTGFTFFVQKVKYDRRLLMLTPLSKPFPIAVDAGKPRSDLGDGKIVIRRANYEPETEEERIVLDVIKAGGDIYEDMVEFLNTKGDMSEREVLETLKELKFRKYKRVVEFPCYFGLFNSKSAPQIRSSLKLEG